MGKRSWLDKALHEKYLSAIAQLEDSDEGRAAAVQLCEELRAGWAKRGFPSLEQQQSLMDDTRRALKQKFGEEHFSLDCIKFSRQEGFELNRQKQGRARDRQLHQQFLENPDAIVQKAVFLLDQSKEWPELAAALAVVTGRRLNEVLRTAEFTVKSRWVVTFTGALKRRGESVPLVFDIPVLTTAERVVRATEQLRQITPPDADESKVGLVSDRIFGDLVPLPHGKGNLYSHLWRSVFCCIATFWYCPPHVDDLLFKAHIMGHFESLTGEEQHDGVVLGERLESFSSERHYRLYEIADSVIANYKGKRKGIKLGVMGIEPLEVFVMGMPEHQVAAERKHRSSLRVWKEDYAKAAAILSHFEGENQMQKVSSWIEWSLRQLQQGVILPGAVVREEDEQGAIAPAMAPVVLHQATDDYHKQSGAAVASEADSVVQGAALRTDAGVGALPSPLEVKLDKLIDLMGLFVQGQIQGAIGQSPVADQGQKKRTRRSKLEGDRTNLAGEDEPLAHTQETPARAGRRRGGDDEIVERAISALMEYNDQPGRSHDEKWFITVSLLKKFTPNSNQRAAQRVLDERADEVGRIIRNISFRATIIIGIKNMT